MEDIIITENNKAMYKKLLNIKEGKLLPNSKCVSIPIILLVLESFILASVLLYMPFLEMFLPNIITVPIKLILFSFSLYGAVKLNTNLSKKMGVKYFKKEFPECNTNISVKDLKEKLEKYRSSNITIYSINKSNNNFESSYNKELTSREKIEILENEKEFLQNITENNDKDIVLTKKIK